jgi:hypothetical protein
VLVGVTVTDEPLVTDRLPGEITPVPPVKLGVSCDDAPVVTVIGEAVKLEIEGAATTVSVASPCTEPDVAVMVAEPAATAVAFPAASMVAAAEDELDHVTDVVTSPVLPSVYVAVATNSCVCPADTVAVVGVTAMLTI